MSTVSAILCIALLVASLFLIIFSLPGTWVILGLTGLWAAFVDGPAFTTQFFLILAGLALLGEIAEFFAGHWGAKKFGGSNKGSMGGMIGAIIGAIVCAPILFGLGALLGALGGGFLGCWLVERHRGMANKNALRAAFGATLGRFGGFIIKLGVGVTMLVLSIPAIWASA
jgi:uncharacterized protein YqgC (DUF456 family)